MLILESLPKKLIQNLDFENCFLVGGAIRDFLINPKNKINDWDFVVFDKNNLKEEIINIANKTFSHFVELDNENGHYRIVNTEENWQADFSKPKGKDLKADLFARDFTINSLAINLKENSLIDYYNGLEDINKKLVRSINQKNYNDDLLRCLRAYRIGCKLNFDILEADRIYISKLMHSNNFLDQISAERITYELFLILSCNNSFKYLSMMKDDYMLESIIPEIQALRDIPPNSHHHLALLDHTLELIKQLEENIINKYKNKSIELNLFILKFASLLHDISKPETWYIDETGKHTFRKHESLGAEKAKLITKRLKFSSIQTKDVYDLILSHMSPFQLGNINEKPSEKAMNRLIRKLDNNFLNLLALAEADLLSTRGESMTREKFEMSQKRLEDLFIQYEIYNKKNQETKPFLRGEELKKIIEEIGLGQTKLIKELLTELRDLQLLDKIKDVNEAKHWFIKESKRRVNSSDNNSKI